MKISTHRFLNRIQDVTDSFHVQTHLLCGNDDIPDETRTKRLKSMNEDIHRQLTICLSEYILTLGHGE